MQKPLKILMLEDSVVDAEIIQQSLLKERPNCEFKLVMTKEDYLQALDQVQPDLILSDNTLPQFSATEALEIFNQRSLTIPFILVTGTVSEEFAATIIKSGADDYILKDRLSRLPAAIDAALKQRKADKEIADYKYALDQSSIISITDQKGIITYANENFCNISKYTAEELIGQDHRIINSGYHPESYIRNLWTTIANGRIWRGEFCNRAKDAGIYWVDATIVPFLKADGKPYQYLAIRSDITEKKKAEEDFRQSEIRLNEAQAIAHISNWEIDLVQNMHTWSDELYRIYGLNRAEVKPSAELFLSFMHPDDADFAQKKVQEAFNSFTDSSFDFRFKRKDGIIRHGYTEWKFEFDKKGNPLRLFGILQDTTERKVAEENLILLEKKIQEQKIQEQKKISRAIIKAQEEEKNRIGQELHDNVNQILAGTKLYLSIAGKKNETVKELVKYPMELIDSSIEQIRLLSRKQVTPLKDIDLEELIKELFNDLEQNKTLKLDFTYTVLNKLLSDDLKLNIYRIIQEQINNILKHADAKSITISIGVKSKAIHITVIDDGKGFNVKSKRKGIGISNMINRIESYNGRIEIKSSPGKGCKIRITIPC